MAKPINRSSLLAESGRLRTHPSPQIRPSGSFRASECPLLAESRHSLTHPKLQIRLSGILRTSECPLSTQSGRSASLATVPDRVPAMPLEERERLSAGIEPVARLRLRYRAILTQTPIQRERHRSRQILPRHRCASTPTPMTYLRHRSDRDTTNEGTLGSLLS